MEGKFHLIRPNIYLHLFPGFMLFIKEKRYLQNSSPAKLIDSVDGPVVEVISPLEIRSDLRSLAYSYQEVL